jgi:hypothetical protein
MHTKFYEDFCRHSSNIKVFPQKLETLHKVGITYGRDVRMTPLRRYVTEACSLIVMNVQYKNQWVESVTYADSRFE